MKIESDATIHILHKGAPVISCQYHFWGPKRKWMFPARSVERMADGSQVIRCEVAT